MEPKADLKRLVDVGEIWALAFRKPRSGGQARLLGRFAEKGIFVGLGAHMRDDMAGNQYEAKAAEAAARWDKEVRFPPLVSGVLGDYLNGNFRDLDDE